MNIEIPNYTLLRELGGGAMAQVWLAEHQSNKRMAAIKLLLRPLGSNDEDAERLFLREGEVLAGFRDENIVAIYDNARVGDQAWIAMEYLPGGTLLERMRRGPISVGESIAYVAQLARALGVVHRAGVIHRDLKPANIMLRDEGTPVLTDFGAARVLERSTIYGKDGGIIGTPIYMSPEQIQGQALDGRSDLYTLGIILFELLTGEPPYRGGSVQEVASQHVMAPLPRLPASVAMLQPVLDRLLAKSPDNRYADADALVDALRELYLADESLRQQVGYSASSAAWSSQLRALGFHLDSLGRSQARIAQGEHLRSTSALAPAPRPPFRTWTLVIAFVAVLAAIGVAWSLRSPPAPAPRPAVAATCTRPACTQLRKILDQAGDGFRALRGEADATGMGWSATAAPMEFGHCRIDADRPPTSLQCRNERKLNEAMRAELFARTRALLREAMPGQAGSDDPKQFVLTSDKAIASLYMSTGTNEDFYVLTLVLSPRATPHFLAAERCDELCAGLCRIANFAGAGYGLDQAAFGDPRPLDGGFVPSGAVACVGTRMPDEAETEAASGYRCDFGSYADPLVADREYQRVGAAMMRALGGWGNEELPAGATGQAPRELRIGNGEVLAVLGIDGPAGAQKLGVEFHTLTQSTSFKLDCQ